MSSATDIQAGDWIDRHVPEAIRPYLRLARVDRPIGTWLLLFPGWWSLALAAPPGGLPDGYVMVLFAIGALVMRGAGCTINDIVDRDFDRQVARTATRPLASGALSLKQALVFLALQLAVAFIILLQLEPLAIKLGVLSLLLVVAYPFMKRITWWPQAFLGLTFNWGALMGYAAVTNDLAWPPLLLYAAGFFWTLFYDTIYAHQDKEDDALIGVKSTARYFGDKTRSWLTGFAIATILLLMLVVMTAGLGWVAKLGVIGVALHLGWQTVSCNFDDAKNCRDTFYSNRFIGWILLAGLVIAKLMQ
ncbi:4-hydroxybenzoate octaprenyltransferase [Dongia sp.]|uniref:4-hydroxybenzoate octaprenyltransferase n=1 Tax=Dongia sp. TaxID=1977262 RepID=UPI003750E849